MRLLIAIFTGLSHSLKIGLIDSDINGSMVCSTAINEARSNQHCVADSIEIERKDGCVPNRPAIGTINAADLFFTTQVRNTLQFYFVSSPSDLNLPDSYPVLAVGTDFSDVQMALTRLDIRALTSMSFVVILMCIGPVEDCFDFNTKNAVVTSGSMVLAPNIENYVQIINSFSAMLQKGLAELQGNFDKYMSLYTACYGYCYGVKEGGTGDTQSFYEIMRNKQFSSEFRKYVLRRIRENSNHPNV
uniref:Secreted protein n=1 Tax=Heterorhabditis bacteriophora TaxID=37862 RepID=A0A1I7X6W6_HETBA